MVKYTLKLDNKDVLTGQTDDGSWGKLQEYLNQTNRKIVSLKIDNEFGSGFIDNDCDGYFIGNKSIAVMGAGGVDMVGIGYWKKNDPNVHILWYDKSFMNLITSEARSVESCGFFFVKNPNE